ncbi:pepsin inhibitor-3-like repeated domain protein [Onchocerca flexuosa]|uniref:Pepsin inhibitor-3-like repeated domain protein n=1 Tax=Onchocerca flexuosa TaxID=387005 RepID=A0A238C2G8_9BILA|nr:pepsin inhibitor-3-like repeated domain protein [Onchocerca flexuosa]
MIFFTIILLFIWLLKLTEPAPIPHDESYSFTKGGRTCSIQNGKLFIDGIFKRNLTMTEMKEVKYWSEAFNQFVTSRRRLRMNLHLSSSREL